MKTWIDTKITMLSYDICKKLKEAGFIFPKYDKFDTYINEGDWFYDTSASSPKRCCYEFDMPKVNALRIPTLLELIDACGDDFINLHNFRGFWQVNFREGMAGEAAGKTPEEAVANLYLALNKKSNQ